MSQNNSNNKAAMMPYIENINKVDGFDPTPFAVEYTDLATGETSKRLPVIIQIAWFRMRYPNGRIAVQVTPAKDCFIATARVYPDYKDNPEHYLAEATASRGYCADKPTVSPREWSQTAAVGIALRNAGFGLQFSMAGDEFEKIATDELGIQESVTKNSPNTEPVSVSNDNTEVPKSAGANVDEEYTVTTTYAETPKELTLEERVQEAMKVPCPITKFNGKSLGDVLREDQNAVVWIATKFSGDEEIKAAAQLICEYSLEQANA